jgi:hypothetical protein
MHTESEAREKWCPWSRSIALRYPSGAPLAASVNRRDDGVTSGECLCIASACMAWRWLPPATNAKVEARRKDSTDPWVAWSWDPRNHPSATTTHEKYEFRDITTERRGYCGNAGGQETQ